MARKSNNEMHKLMKRGARGGSMQRALQLNLMNKTDSNQRDFLSVHGNLIRQVSIDKPQYRTQISFEEPPRIERTTSSVHGSVGFHYRSHQRMTESLYETNQDWVK